jgi:riboflavin synthase
MFTGIITGVGRIVAVHDLGRSLHHGKRLSHPCPPGYLDDVGLGDSIAINGACMTVTTFSPEKTSFASTSRPSRWTKPVAWTAWATVNLEKALRANDRLGGHLVSGHVDGMGSVSNLNRWARAGILRLLAPADLGKYLAYKGSITVNGVSLTVNRVLDHADGTEISINLIPHTVQNTALAPAQAGQQKSIWKSISLPATSSACCAPTPAWHLPTHECSFETHTHLPC